MENEKYLSYEEATGTRKLESPGIFTEWELYEHRQAQLKKNGVYVASRASVPERSAMWRELRTLGWRITSTWIDEAGEGETADYADLWCRISNEIYESCALILYAEKDDFPLKGALVEVGIAIGFGKPIYVVKKFEVEGRTMRPIGSWIAHPMVTVVDSVQEALDMAFGLVRNPAVEPITLTMTSSEIDAIINKIDPTFWERNNIKVTEEEIEQWAALLAADSLECGEAEYGPDYPSNKT